MTKVTAAIIIDSGKVFIAKRKSAGRLPDMWEFPGGKLEVGETPEQCLKRELQEEFEIEVMIGESVGTSVYEYDFGTIELLSYRAEIVAGEIKLNDHAEVAWAEAGDLGRFEFAPADVPFVQMICRGEIKI